MNNITLNLDHPSKKRTEHFLNAVKDELIPIPFVPENWEHRDLILGGFEFIGKHQPLSITVIFADSYHDANEIGRMNAFPMLPHSKWTVNGDVFYLVESSDTDRVNEVTSLFAGKE